MRSPSAVQHFRGRLGGVRRMGASAGVRRMRGVARGEYPALHGTTRLDELHGRVVVANPDEDCSPAVFRVLIDELSIAPEPELESLDAAAVLETIRAESEHA